MKHHRQNNFSKLKCLGGIIHDEMNAKWRNNAALYHAKCFSEQKGEERKIGPLLIVKFRRWTKGVIHKPRCQILSIFLTPKRGHFY